MSYSVRVGVDLAPEMLERIETLMQQCGKIGGTSYSREHLFYAALTLLLWAVEEHEKNRQIASVDDANKRYYELDLETFLASVTSPKKH